MLKPIEKTSMTCEEHDQTIIKVMREGSREKPMRKAREQPDPSPEPAEEEKDCRMSEFKMNREPEEKEPQNLPQRTNLENREINKLVEKERENQRTVFPLAEWPIPLEADGHEKDEYTRYRAEVWACPRPRAA